MYPGKYGFRLFLDWKDDGTFGCGDVYTVEGVPGKVNLSLNLFGGGGWGGYAGQRRIIAAIIPPSLPVGGIAPYNLHLATGAAWAIGHEIAHVFGLAHPFSCQGELLFQPVDGAFVPTNSRIAEVGIDVWRAIVAYSNNVSDLSNAVKLEHYPDFMAYAGADQCANETLTHQWISPYHWIMLFERIRAWVG
jgi:hypothetical protein